MEPGAAGFLALPLAAFSASLGLLEELGGVWGDGEGSVG